jgi:hypothetical protein
MGSHTLNRNKAFVIQALRGKIKKICIFYCYMRKRGYFCTTFSRRVLHFNGSVVQLVRIRACHARGRGFESRPDRKK